MAIKSWPYTSIDGDRKITASDEAAGYDLFISSGVVPGWDDELQVTKVTDTLSLSIAAGAAVIAGHRLISDDAETVDLDAGDTNPRIDIIVAESNKNTPYRKARFTVVKGTPASSPAPPDLTQTDAIWQIPLAQIYIPAGATNLNSATVTDARIYTEGRHAHDISNVVNLQTALDGKAAASHTHTISNVTNLQSALDGKAAASHTHSIETITLGTGDTITWDNTNNVLTLTVAGCTPVQLCPIVFGTGTTPPAGTYPKGTIYLRYKP